MMLSSHVDMTFAPGSVCTYQDSEGGGGRNWPSPLFSPSQRRTAPLLSSDLNCIRTRRRDVIASSNPSLNCSLSRGSKPRIDHRSVVDTTVSRAFSNSLAISFMDRSPNANPIGGRRPTFQLMKEKSPTDYLLIYEAFDGLKGYMALLDRKLSILFLLWLRGAQAIERCPKTLLPAQKPAMNRGLLGKAPQRGEGWGEGVRIVEQIPGIRAPSSCPSPLWGEGTRRLCCELILLLAAGER
jgi:hypothetical protein